MNPRPFLSSLSVSETMLTFYLRIAFLLAALPCRTAPAANSTLNVHQALEIGLKQSASILQSKIRLEKERIRTLQTRGLFMPTVNLQTSRRFSRPNLLGESRLDSASLAIGQKLDLTGRDIDIQQAANIRPEIATIDLLKTKSKFSETLIHYFLDLFLARSRLESTNFQHEQAKTLVTFIKAKAKRGRLSKADLLEADYRLKSTASELLAHEQSIRSIEAQISQQLYPQTESLTISYLTENEFNRFLEERVLKQYTTQKTLPMDSRWLASNSLEVEAFTKKSLGNRRFLPELYFGYQVSKDLSGQEPQSPSPGWVSQAVVLEANWNLFNGFSDSYAKRLDHEELKLLQLNKSLAESNLKSNWKILLDEISTNKQLFDAKIDLVNLANQKYKSAKAMFDAGRLSTRDLIEQQSHISDAELLRNQSQVAYYKSIVSFLHISNTLLDIAL